MLFSPQPQAICAVLRQLIKYERHYTWCTPGIRSRTSSFSFYINDLPMIVKNCEITLFADDTKNFGDYNENSHLVGLNKISEWMYNNKLTLNEAKTQFLLVGKKLNNQTISPGITLKFKL